MIPCECARVRECSSVCARACVCISVCVRFCVCEGVGTTSQSPADVTMFPANTPPPALPTCVPPRGTGSDPHTSPHWDGRSPRVPLETPPVGPLQRAQWRLPTRPAARRPGCGGGWGLPSLSQTTVTSPPGPTACDPEASASPWARVPYTRSTSGQPRRENTHIVFQPQRWTHGIDEDPVRQTGFLRRNPPVGAF